MQLARSKRSIDMTSGPLFSKIILFILPLMATNLLQTFYNAADIMIAGLSSEPDAVGAVGSTSALTHLIVNIFIGISVGADVIVARYIGAKNSGKTSEAVHTSVCISFIFGIAGALIGFFISEPVLVAMGYTGNLLRLGTLYARLYFACLPFLSLTNFLSAIMRAKGDTKTPLYIMLGAGVLNVGLNTFFVLALGLSVEGVAIATAIANAVSAAVMWYVLANDEGDCRLYFKKLKIRWDMFKEICYIGFPSGIQNALFSLSNILINSSIVQVNNAVTPVGSAYEPVVKGHSAGGSIESFVFTAINSVMQAASTFTSQNVGIKDYKRVKRVFFSVLTISAFVSIFFSGLVIILRDPLHALYGVKNLDDTLSRIAYDTAMRKVFYKWTMFIFFAFMNSSAGVLRGLGRSVMSASFSLIGTCVFRVVWIYTAFPLVPTLECIFISYPISWALTGIAFFIAVSVILRKKLAEQNV